MASQQSKKRDAEEAMGAGRTNARRTDTAPDVHARDEGSYGAVADTANAAEDEDRSVVEENVRGQTSADLTDTSRFADHQREEDADDQGTPLDADDQDVLRAGNEDDELVSCDSKITQLSGQERQLLYSEYGEAAGSDAASEGSDVSLTVGSDGIPRTGRTPPSSESSPVHSIIAISTSDDDADAPPVREFHSRYPLSDDSDDSDAPPRPPLYAMVREGQVVVTPAAPAAMRPRRRVNHMRVRRTPSPEHEDEEKAP